MDTDSPKHYKLGVFGESFSCRLAERYQDMGLSWMSWIAKLKNYDDSDILVDGIPGRSNWGSFSNLYNSIERGNTFDHIVFVATSLHRLPLTNHTSQSFAYNRSLIDTKLTDSTEIDFDSQHMKFADTFKSESGLSILDFMKCWWDFIHTPQDPDLEEYISLDATRQAILKCAKHNIDVTILIPFMYGGPQDYSTLDRILEVISDYDVNIIGTLMDVSGQEIIAKEQIAGKGAPWKNQADEFHDPRPCHLISENNRVLAKTIIKGMDTPELLRIYDFPEHPDLVFDAETLSKYVTRTTK